MISEEYYEGDVITMPGPARKGYTFRYWKGSRYEAGQKYTVTEDHTFTAQWKKKGSGGGDGDGDGSGSRTGDRSMLSLWALLMATSFLALLAIFGYRRTGLRR